jgi:hypothetical protein
MDSWVFVIFAICFPSLWMGFNRGTGFDPYPFILLSLLLSCLAALQGAILLIVARRSDQITAELAQHDDDTNLNAAAEIDEPHASVQAIATGHGLEPRCARGDDRAFSLTRQGTKRFDSSGSTSTLCAPSHPRTQPRPVRNDALNCVECVIEDKRPACAGSVPRSETIPRQSAVGGVSVTSSGERVLSVTESGVPGLSDGVVLSEAQAAAVRVIAAATATILAMVVGFLMKNRIAFEWICGGSARHRFRRAGESVRDSDAPSGVTRTSHCGVPIRTK